MRKYDLVLFRGGCSNRHQMLFHTFVISLTLPRIGVIAA